MSLRTRLTEPSGRQAELFRGLPNGRVQCTACARNCQIGEGQVGFCGIRGVVGGKLYLLVYGRVTAGHIDPIEKKPVVHYRPGSKIFSIATSGCSWACAFCQNNDISQLRKIEGVEASPEDLVRNALSLISRRLWKIGSAFGMEMYRLTKLVSPLPLKSTVTQSRKSSIIATVSGVS